MGMVAIEWTGFEVMMAEEADFKPAVWRGPDGEPVSCVEKIKVLNDNLGEIHELCQDSLEDAVLMGCDEDQFRLVIDKMAKSLVNPYKARTGK